MSEPYGHFDNGNQFRIKLDSLIDSRMLIQANSGGGKSYAVRKLLELTHGGVQQIVIDPEGEFATLREKFDYVVASGHGGDALAHPRTAKLLAERLLETSVSAIVDIYELKPHERTSFVRLFLEAMVNAPKHLWHPCLVVLDEAHVYAPEAEKSEAHGAVADLATRGRKRGFCLVAATQRISKLSKDVAAELNNKLIGRATLDVDVKRAAGELGIPVGEAMTKLRALEPGQFYAFGPSTNTAAPALIKVGEVLTRHPKRGERATATPKPTQAILDVLPKLADLPKEAEKELRTVEDLRKELAQVRRELTIARNAKPGIDDRALQLACDKAEGHGHVHGWHLGYARAMEDARRGYSEAAQVMADKFADMISMAARIAGDQNRPDVKASVHMSPKAPPATRKAIAEVVRHASREISKPQSEGISRPQQKILDAIAWLNDKGIDPPNKNAVAAIAEASPSSSSYTNNLGAMKSAGLIDYPQPGYVRLTTEGGAYANSPAPGEPHEKWLEIVTEPQARILRALLSAHPEPMQKDSLADAAGAAATSSSYTNNLGALRTLGAIDYPQKGFAALTKYVMP